MNLIVIFPFGSYERGQCITDATEIAIILLGENASHVRKVPAVAKPEVADPKPAEALPPKGPAPALAATGPAAKPAA